MRLSEVLAGDRNDQEVLRKFSVSERLQQSTRFPPNVD
ncbi:hypothetical protein BDK62_11758 [Halomonas alkaliantarctica]|nr:hypothetical protein BDK62_11758 [Halomonas alkaliantarctica]